ncbi:MAG: 50S ribosomal protein L15 [Deltaproteobacteria bacterium]|nr:50S ribosomal protein L15 [Deltaproteobacteria bacterium]
MKNLGNLSPAEGANKSTKRLGRGIGSGLGKTAGKGHKGQKARKSGNPRPGFEGGQTPIYRRIPKHGFTNNQKKIVYNIINLSDLNRFETNEVVNRKSLKEKNLLRYKDCPIKLLADGELTKPVVVEVDKLSSKAKEAVEKLGGKIQGKT